MSGTGHQAVTVWIENGDAGGRGLFPSTRPGSLRQWSREAALAIARALTTRPFALSTAGCFGGQAPQYSSSRRSPINDFAVTATDVDLPRPGLCSDSLIYASLAPARLAMAFVLFSDLYVLFHGPVIRYIAESTRNRQVPPDVAGGK